MAIKRASSEPPQPGHFATLGMGCMFGAVLLLASCAPDGIARATCQGEMLATGDPEHCKVSAEFITQKSAIHFDSESRNHVAQVQIRLRVAKGTLRVGYSDLRGPHQVTITPQAPF